MSGMFEQTGAVWITPGGNTEHPEAWGPIVKWCALNIGAEAERDPDWVRMRQLCAGAGVAAFPWLHCHSNADIDRLIAKAQSWNAPAIGLNIEDVVTDGLVAPSVASKVKGWGRDCLVITLPWLANGWGWGALSDYPFALEYFPYDPAWNPAFNDRGGLRDHACAEGAKLISFMYGTYPTGVARPDGSPPYEMRVAHSLYYGGAVGTTQAEWQKWAAPLSNPYMPCPGGTPVPPPAPLTAQQVPYTGPYSVAGKGRHAGPTAEALKRAMKRAQYGFANKPLGELNQVFNTDLEGALDRWDPGKDGYADGRWNKIRALVCPAESPHEGEYALDEYAQRLIREESMATQAPSLGPVFAGGQSVLLHDLTHETSGLPLYPAFDDAFGQYIVIVAPEQIRVTKASSSNPGDAFYGEGVSKLRYWFGHLVEAPAVGTVINKGSRVGETCPNTIGGGPHVHVAINVEGLWGAGKELTHKTSYQHGAPTVGDQLAAGKPLPMP